MMPVYIGLIRIITMLGLLSLSSLSSRLAFIIFPFQA